MAEFRVMGIAVANGRIGYVVLANDNLVDWAVSRTASRSPEKAAETAKEWIDLLKPKVVVTEALGSNRRKRGKTLALMESIGQAARDSDAINVTIAKVRSHQDKYEEAQTLAQQYPELRPRLANKPACWLPEPRRMILFEALALALRIQQTR